MKKLTWFAGVLAFALAGGALLWPEESAVGQMTAEEAARATGLPIDIQVDAEPLALSLSGQQLNIAFVGGWVLVSEHQDFGGFSGLVIEEETSQLVAINDKGDWWQVPFDAMNAVAPAGGTMRAYTLGAVSDKANLDAESLLQLNGGYLISFEQVHRLEFQPEVGGKPTHETGFAAIDFAGVSKNSGMEAIALLPSGELLAFTERGRDTQGKLKAWLVSAEQAEPLFFAPPKNFAPTDAATLPNGDVLVLLRKFSAVEGVEVRLHHLSAADIKPGAVLVGDPVLRLTPEGPVDNMEGLDVVALDDNTVRIAMISDDNFNPLQRTLLMLFDYKYQ
ncbi:MAG: esterase-like activity of phytase family protein [Kordiimonadaceae bacterium]|nr:esterase-like activity of phytase family protein [Kordiimonadaceae bacterium]MBO6568487.1 esterase-like activity of phytase family protein [Kordiimonadaceae bacterium]MBO6963784.1 esterase-like activity of phytase family protein [Kordiimonadaceae bacterium]